MHNHGGRTCVRFSPPINNCCWFVFNNMSTVHSCRLIHKFYELGSGDGEFVSFNGLQPFNVRAKVLRQDLVRGRAKVFHGRNVLYYSNANSCLPCCFSLTTLLDIVQTAEVRTGLDVPCEALPRGTSPAARNKH
jgi:hypothetical protein